MEEADSSYGIVVVGSGAGGTEAALHAARRGVGRVLLVDKLPIGGGALRAGAIPMRSLMASARLLRQLRNTAAIGGESGDEFAEAQLVDWINRQRHTVARLASQTREGLHAAGVETARGDVRLLGGGRLLITDREREGHPEREVQAAHIILATGARSGEPEEVSPGAAIGTSRRFVSLAETPRSLIIIGGGHVGCEFATIYHALGAQVTLIERNDRLLSEMDREAGEELLAEFQGRGIDVRLSREGQPVWPATPQDQAAVHLLPDDEELLAEKVLLARGRVPNVEGIDLEKAGVDYCTKRGITVDEFLQTTAPGISAIGDVNGLSTLSDSARAQARLAVENALGSHRPFDPGEPVRSVHTDPAVAAVGLSEDWALAQGRAVRVASVTLRSPTALPGLDGESGGIVKLVAEPAPPHRLLGGMMVGEHATEWIDEVSLAVRLGANAEAFAAVPRGNERFAAAIGACVGQIVAQ